MPVSTTYTPLETAGAALAAAVNLTWPDLEYVGAPDPYEPPDELTADIDRARQLLEQLVRERTNYAVKAGTFNARESDFDDAADEYATRTAAHTANIQATWTDLDGSARSAETELEDIGDTGTWDPGTATTPTYDVAAVVLRARTAGRACKRYPTLVPISEALLQGADVLERANARPPILRAVSVPETPTGEPLNTLVTKATLFTEYLAGS